MKGLAELVADNEYLVAKANGLRRSSLRRLKQRLSSRMVGLSFSAYQRRIIREEIDAWAKREEKRGCR